MKKTIAKNIWALCAISLISCQEKSKWIIIITIIRSLHHWEIPSKDPDRVMLNFHGDPATRRAVTWRTDRSVKQAVAEIAEATVDSKFTENAVTIGAKTEPFDLGLYKSNNSLMVNYHSVIFDQLKPNTNYV